MGKLHNVLSLFSYQRIRKKKLDSFALEDKKLRDMSNDELWFGYVELKARYDHEKDILTFFVITLLLSVLMGIWNKFFEFVEAALKYAAECNDIEIKKKLMMIECVMEESVIKISQES